MSTFCYDFLGAAMVGHFGLVGWALAWREAGCGFVLRDDRKGEDGDGGKWGWREKGEGNG